METYTVFNPITPLPQNIILQIQQLESRKQILDEIADLHWPGVVTESDWVDSQTGLPYTLLAKDIPITGQLQGEGMTDQLLNHRNQRKQILLNSEMEGILFLEIHGD